LRFNRVVSLWAATLQAALVERDSVPALSIDRRSKPESDGDGGECQCFADCFSFGMCRANIMSLVRAIVMAAAN